MTKEIIAQGFGIIGLLITVYSFQVKENKNFFICQGLGGFMFFLNFILIGAVAGALFNLTNLIRGILFSKNDHKLWKLILTEVLYTGCFVFSLTLIYNDPFQIFLSALPYVALVLMSVFMWYGNGKHIRCFQIVFMSPSWIVHNIFNFTLGGLVCEVLNMISTLIALIRFRKEQLTD